MQDQGDLERLCTNDEKVAYQFVIDHIGHAEPCSVAGIADSGKKLLYKAVVAELKRYEDIPKRKVVSAILFEDKQTTHETIHTVESLLSAGNQVNLIMCILSEAAHMMDFKTLQKLRNVYGVQFTSVIISDLRPVYDAYLSKDGIVWRSLYARKPFSPEDALQLIGAFSNRMQFTPKEQVTKEIIRLSGGGAGLIKSLFLIAKEGRILDTSVLGDMSIQYRLERLFTDIPETLQAKLIRNIPLVADEKAFLTLFGVLTEKGSFFSPLLTDYVDKKRSSQPTDNSLTNVEIQLYDLFKSQITVTVSRDAIADVLWGQDGEDRYSDWAIDQAIHRLREKLSASGAPYEVKTKKGVGFVLLPRTSS